ncbi:hypothetical protein MHYP_G00256260 [Metynnis hypsauchen]
MNGPESIERHPAEPGEGINLQVLNTEAIWILTVYHCIALFGDPVRPLQPGRITTLPWASCSQNPAVIDASLLRLQLGPVPHSPAARERPVN